MSRGIPRSESVFAQEGTAAHELAEKCLRDGKNALEYIGFFMETVEVTDEMAEHVQTYLDHCRSLMSAAPAIPGFAVEHRISLGGLLPSPIYGTVDFVCRNGGALHVVDLKYGKGIVVEPENNSQLLIYAIGALRDSGSTGIERVRLSIVQPRAYHPLGAIRSWDVSAAQLAEFSDKLNKGAWATESEDAPLHAGEHCRFCPAHAQCPEASNAALALARIEFNDVGTPSMLTPPAPGLLTVQELAKLLPMIESAESWFAAVRAECSARLTSGIDVPGYKLVERSAHRKWRSEEQTLQWLSGRLPKRIALERSLRSPAQIEKLLKARGKKKLKIPQSLILQQSSGLAMVPSSDPREPAQRLSASDEFAQHDAALLTQSTTTTTDKGVTQ